MHQKPEGQLLYFSDCKTHSPPQIWEENWGASYSPNVAYLAHRGWGEGHGSGMGPQEAGAGSPLQEASGGRSGALLRALGWKEGVSKW